MRSILLTAAIVSVMACTQTTPPPSLVENPGLAAAAEAEDPYLWLEEVQAPKALDWARANNAITSKELEGDPNFAPIRENLLKVLESKDRIAYAEKMGEYFYNFWRDDKNVRGIWRRTTLAEYLKSRPEWETLLDLDELALKDQENWVWKGTSCVQPGFDRCLLNLSRGGADAVVIREFDLASQSFVADGFSVPEAKTVATFLDRDTLLVSSDFGPGTQTTSGYARQIKRWQRGTELKSAELVFEGELTDVASAATVAHTRGERYEIYQRSPDFFTNQSFVRLKGNVIKLDKPDDAEVTMAGTDLLITLRKDWAPAKITYPMGSLLAINFADFIQGARDFAVLFEPSERTSLAGLTVTQNYIVLNVLDNVGNRLLSWRRDGDKWVSDALATPGFGTLNIRAIDDASSDDYFLTSEDFLTPSSLFIGTVGERDQRLVKQLPAFFDSSGMKIQQFEATSADGTRVPYFMVSRADVVLDGSNPTLLGGYGGFEVSRLPVYSGGLGQAWLSRGNVYVLANIRGGGEFGPRWHQAALKANRQRAFDDFISVAEDLAARKVTSPKHLGIQGGSNGGLLMGVMMTQRPDLFGAIVCQVPLLDMKRYHKLLAGASWMAEYGDPDQPEQWAYLSAYSPYQLVKAEQKYPRTLFTTSTRDDRVHPGHARKMVARMQEQKHDVLYYENIEGGHGGAANSAQSAYLSALSYTFLLRETR